MNELFIALGIFLILASASLGAMYVSPKMPDRHRDDDTNSVVRLVANIFVVMSSLVFGLMINSAKTTFESLDAGVHAYATNIILIDRALRTYGLAGKDARDKLLTYLEHAVTNPARADTTKPDEAGQALDALGDSLLLIQLSSGFRQDLLSDIRQQYHRLVEQRWGIIGSAEGSIPMPIVGILAAWLTLIFASFGYRAPQNVVPIVSFIVAAGLISTAFYLVLDMDIPFHGPIQISDAPLRRALMEVRS